MTHHDTIQKLRDAMPEIVERYYPKGDKGRGKAMVAMAELK